MSSQAENSETATKAAVTEIEETHSHESSEHSARLEEEKPRSRRIPRKLQPANQLRLTWLLALSTCAFFILTVYYAFGTSFLLRSPLINDSPSNTILVIRILSGITEYHLVGLVAECFERIKWMLVASKRGSPILHFLSLSEGTGPLGLLTLIFARIKNVTGSRLWSLLRGTGLILVPALGVVILGDVNLSRVYVSNDGFPISGGIGNFNASWASNPDLQLTSGLLFATDFSSFLTNQEVSYPISSVNSAHSSCINGGGGVSGDCTLSYYVSGGLGLISPWPAIDYRYPDSPLYTVRQSHGYHFDFSPLPASAEFLGSKDCTLYGGGTDAVLFCFSAYNPFVLNMKWVHCPPEVSFENSCLKTSSWRASTGWTASLQAYHRTATVHYYRSNSTIAAVEDLGTPKPVAIAPNDLFRVYNSSFKASGSGGEFSAGRQFITYVNTFLSFAQQTNSTSSTAVGRLRNLAVLPLFYFQPTYENPDLKISPNEPMKGLPKELYATASFSKPLYRLVVGKATLVAYTVTGAILIIICLTVLVLGSLPALAGSIVEPSPFSTLDLSTGCTDGVSESELNERLRECKGLTGTKLLKKLKDIKLHIRRDEEVEEAPAVTEEP